MTRLFNEILGKNVEVPNNSKRIISFSPAVTETLFMLGLGENIVGVSGFCARPDEAMKKRRSEATIPLVSIYFDHCVPT